MQRAVLVLALVALGCAGRVRGHQSPPDRPFPADAGQEDSLPDATDDVTAPPTGSCGDWTSRTPIRALFVGNSQIEFWELQTLVTRLSESAPADCPRIIGDGFTRGGDNLGGLFRNGSGDGRSLEAEFASGNYDVVVLAESIDLVEFNNYEATFRQDATAIIEAARSANVTPILYATPYIERPDRSGFREMAEPNLTLGRELSVVVAAGGLAWLRVWEQEPNVDLYHPDRQHPGYRGSYISALVIYSAITGASPEGLTADANIHCPNQGRACPPIEPQFAPMFQGAALAQHRETGR